NIMAIEGDLIDYYFIYGPDFKSILFSYTGLTGRSPVPPKWSFGVWMSRISYKSEEEVLSVAKRLRDEKYPMDVIHIDTNWFDRDWECDWKFSKERFPDPEGMCRKLDKMGFKISLWQTPYIVNTLKEYKEAKKKKIVGKNHGPFLFLVAFPSVPIDFSNPEGVKWYQEKLANLFKIGARVIKTDFGEAIEPHQEFLKYNGREMHNLYPLLYQKAAFEATKEFFGKGIVWARSAYAGCQRYPVHWSGDSSSQFEEMLNVLRGGLSLGLCGFTYWSQDVGGFIVSPTDQLYIRWTQFSVFNSHIRYHGSPPRYREPWNYSKETQRITREFLNLRYRLIPYIYSEARHASERGLPMLAPMVLEFQHDRTTFNIEDQFMFGRFLLIAPILTRENEERQVYLPKGKWYDFWSLEQHKGPAWINCECQIDMMPIFIREGAILPMGPLMQFVDEKELKSIELIITSVESEKLDYIIAMDDDQDISVLIEHNQDILIIKISRDIEEIVVKVPAISGIKEIKVNERILSLKKNKESIIAS
ncbi:MAG: glycoside hydrolase family 31 protein, partial [Candidatus Hodarchaeota archaeon]